MNDNIPRQDVTADALAEIRRERFLRVLDECRAALRDGERRFRARWSER